MALKLYKPDQAKRSRGLIAFCLGILLFYGCYSLYEFLGGGAWAKPFDWKSSIEGITATPKQLTRLPVRNHPEGQEGVEVWRNDAVAESVGLRELDVVREVAGKKVLDLTVYERVLRELGEGEKVPLTVTRVYVIGEVLGDEFPLAPRTVLTLMLLAASVALVYWVCNRESHVEFLAETEAEMKRVTWASRTEVIDSSIVVIITVIILAIYIGLIDVLLITLKKRVPWERFWTAIGLG